MGKVRQSSLERVAVVVVCSMVLYNMLIDLRDATATGGADPLFGEMKPHMQVESYESRAEGVAKRARIK